MERAAPAPTVEVAHALIDDLVEELGLVAAGAHETYRDLALNLLVALHHRRDPDAPCWQGLYVLLALELSHDHVALGDALKNLLVALDDSLAAQSPDHEADSEDVAAARVAVAKAYVIVGEALGLDEAR
jgi:hypothetical protein